eukprot:81980_1
MDSPTLFEEFNKYVSLQQLPEIKQDYTSNTNNTKCTTQIFKKIAQLLNIDSDNNDSFSLSNRKSNNKLATCYCQFSLGINQHITNNELFKQLQCSNSVSRCIECTAMKHYMDAYQTLVHKQLSCTNKKMSIGKYNDNINVITQYMIRINTNINRVLFRKTSYPIQMDMFFVAPDAHKQLNLHALGRLKGVKTNNDSRKNTAAINIGDVYRLINGQRFIMLIGRGNNDDIINATIYALNFTRNKRMSDYVELMYLLNNKSMSIPGFKHHLNAVDCNKAYISYDDYKSCVFKNDIEKCECIKITKCELNSVQPTYTDLKTEIIALGISSKKYE